MTSAAILILLVAIPASGEEETVKLPASEKPAVKPPPPTEPVKEVDVIDLIFHPKNRDAPSENVPWKLRFAGIPYISYNPATSLQIGVAGNIGYYGGDLATTSISDIIASAAYTLRDQVLVAIRSSIFTNNNALNLQGDWRFNMTNQDTWGLGPMKANSDVDLIDFNWLRVYQTVYFRVAPSLYIGVGFNADWQYSIVDQNVRAGKHSYMNDYYGGNEPSSTLAIGLSGGLLFDSRDNQINPTKGYLANASLKVFPKAFGGTDTWESLWLEFRAYPKLGGRNILAFWLWGWFAFGQAPYLDLPAVGWDMFGRSGRGYAAGRIRGNNLLYAEVEYRIHLMKNDLLGMVVFVNATAASDPITGSFTGADPAGGVGLRIKVNRKSESNLAVDLGYGERESICFYIAIQEAF